MDVNGTRFKLLLGEDDWGACTDADSSALALAWAGRTTASDTAWDTARGELTLRALPFEFPAGVLDRPPRLADRRGAGADVYGNWYWIDSDARTILVESIGDGSTAQFWPGRGECAPAPVRLGVFGPAEPAASARGQQVSGGAVTDDHFLVVGTVEPPGLLVFDLLTGGAPTALPWPAGAAFRPFDIARRPGGGVFILDAEHRLVWELDRTFHVASAGQLAVDPPEAGRFEPSGAPWTARLSGLEATAVDGDPIAVEAAPEGGFLLLDRNEASGVSLIAYYRAGVEVGTAAPVGDVASGLSVVAHDMALVGDTIYVADSLGNQAYAFPLTLGDEGPRLALAQSYYPMRLFGAKGLVAAAGQVWYDFGDGWIPLVSQPRMRYQESALLLTPAFDSGEPGCVWHRLTFDAILPPETSITVSSMAADDPDALALAEWSTEPPPIARSTGAEVPFVDLGVYQTYELLFQAARGRHLRLRIELRGDGRSSPRIRALRAWFPRFSYLDRYLPGVYREDTDSSSFLDRYLANVEGMSTAIEDRIAAAQVLLHPATVPQEWLDWLASWFDLALDPMWDDARRRLFLANAMRFFAARGTIRAVEIALRFVFDACVDESVFADTRPSALATPRIVESFRTRKTPGVVFGDPTDPQPPRVVIGTQRWTPDQGRDALDQGYAKYLGVDSATYPIAESDEDSGDAWRTFSRAVVGFVPEVSDAGSWQAFLARRYPNPAALAKAYGLTPAPQDFGEIQPPTSLPPDGAPLVDWFQYQAVVVPTKRKAHRFTVLLPWPARVYDSAGHVLDHVQLRELARRIVDLQKPAHTIYDIRFFWAAFRVGEARLGDDTLLGTGSRFPELLTPPAVLSRDYVGTTVLAGPVATDQIRRIPPIPSTDEEAP